MSLTRDVYLVKQPGLGDGVIVWEKLWVGSDLQSHPPRPVCLPATPTPLTLPHPPHHTQDGTSLHPLVRLTRVTDVTLTFREAPNTTVQGSPQCPPSTLTEPLPQVSWGGQS